MPEIPATRFADDDGSADPVLAAALASLEADPAALPGVVSALAEARVLIPVLAAGEERFIGRHGLEQDEIGTTGVVAVSLPDGRAALPVFSSVATMSAWRADARPVPAEGPRAALAAADEQWAALVIDPAGPAVVVPRPAVWALAQGHEWAPAVVGDEVAPDVAAAVADAVGAVPGVSAAGAEPGRRAELAVVIALPPGLTRAQVTEVTTAAQQALAASEVVAQRVDSLEIRLATA